MTSIDTCTCIVSLIQLNLGNLKCIKQDFHNLFLGHLLKGYCLEQKSITTDMYMHILLSITMRCLDKRKTSSYTYLQKKVSIDREKSSIFSLHWLAEINNREKSSIFSLQSLTCRIINFKPTLTNRRVQKKSLIIEKNYQFLTYSDFLQLTNNRPAPTLACRKSN